MEVWTCTKWYENIKENFENRLANKKEQVFHFAFEEPNSRINKGMGFTLTELREYISSLDKDPNHSSYITAM